LPRATHTRSDREAAKGKQSGRTQEIQRLIGRSLRAVLRDSNVGWYVVLVLGLLGLADTLQGYAFGVMAPEIARTLGISRSELTTLNALKTLATAALTVPLVMTVQRTPRRALVSVTAAFVWALFALMTSFVTTLAGLTAVLLVDGATSGARGTPQIAPPVPFGLPLPPSPFPSSISS
jgi:hypothetical protein